MKEKKYVWIVKEVISGRVIFIARSHYNAVEACRDAGYEPKDVEIRKWELI